MHDKQSNDIIIVVTCYKLMLTMKGRSSTTLDVFCDKSRLKILLDYFLNMMHYVISPAVNSKEPMSEEWGDFQKVFYSRMNESNEEERNGIYFRF